MSKEYRLEHDSILHNRWYIYEDSEYGIKCVAVLFNLELATNVLKMLKKEK